MDTLQYLVDKYRVDLTRRSPLVLTLERSTDIPRLFCELGFNVGAEIGVFRGLYSAALCQANPDLHLYCIDAWLEYPSRMRKRQQQHLEDHYEAAVEKLAALNCTIIRKWSMDAVVDFEDDSLDFVYIDANHNFEFITNDIAQWRKKVRPDGIISGHDFGRGTNPEFGHVKDVVSAWTYSHRIHPWFVLQSPLWKTDRSWMWVKT